MMITQWPNTQIVIPRGSALASSDAVKRAISTLEQRTNYLKELADAQNQNPTELPDFVALFLQALNN